MHCVGQAWQRRRWRWRWRRRCCRRRCGSCRRRCRRWRCWGEKGHWVLRCGEQLGSRMSRFAFFMGNYALNGVTARKSTVTVSIISFSLSFLASLLQTKDLWVWCHCMSPYDILVCKGKFSAPLWKCARWRKKRKRRTWSLTSSGRCASDSLQEKLNSHWPQQQVAIDVQSACLFLIRSSEALFL